MLSRKYRFQGLGSVRPVMARGRQVRDPERLFTLKTLERGVGQGSRVGVVISRKTAKSAVERNRLRRRIYAIFRENWTELIKPVDLVIIVHDNHLGELTPETLKKRLWTAIEAATKPPAKHHST